MFMIRIIKSKTLIYEIYLPETSKASNKKGVIYCPGLPDYPHKRPYAKKWTENGFTFLELRYMGSWESNGRFSPENCLKSIQEAVDFFKKGKAKELRQGSLLQWNIKEIILLGNSFGGAVILSALPILKDINRAILLAPLIDISLLKQGLKIIEQDTKKDELYHLLKNGFSNVYRGLSLKSWQKFLQEKSLINPFKYTHQLISKKLLFVHGNQDHVVPIKATKRFVQKLKKNGALGVELKVLPTKEHGSGLRILSMNLVIKWAKQTEC